jgi:hypothetical protein
MNNLRQLCIAFILMLVLSATALAGTIDCPGVTQQPTGETQSVSEGDSTITEALLILIEGILLAP